MTAKQQETPMDASKIEALALMELDLEDHRAAVEAAKERIRARQGRPWWDRLLPFTIRIERR